MFIKILKIFVAVICGCFTIGCIANLSEPDPSTYIVPGTISALITILMVLSLMHKKKNAVKSLRKNTMPNTEDAIHELATDMADRIKVEKENDVRLFKNDKKEDLTDKYEHVDQANISAQTLQNETGVIVLDSGIQINPDSLFRQFGSDRLSLTKELTNTYGMGLKSATKLAADLYNNYFDAFSNQAIDWKPTQKINRFFEIDEVNNRFAILEAYGFTLNKFKLSATCDYNDLLSYELLEDGNEVTSGGLGRAAVGALAFGGVGAVVGGVTGKKTTKKETSSLKIKIVRKGISSAPLYITLIALKVKNNSMMYRMAYNEAQQILAVLDQISASQEETQSQESTQLSPADEILKYKNLLDMGAITQEEFDSKKRELLGL